MSSLCPMGLRGQTDKHPLRGHTNPYTKVIYCVDIVRFGPKEALTTLKRVYKVKRNPYL